MSSNSLIGRTIGKYKIVQHLGRGGMAEVYKAYHENLDRYVAIKLMHPFLADEKDFLTRFQREARAMAAISHPNIIDVFDFDVEDNTYYIVMEYVSGGTLKEAQEQLAANGTQMELSRAIQVVLEVADALSFAHSRGMIHRDIKPANIMLNEHGSAVLTDFGIAKIMSGPSYTATGAMVGTPAYMAPEQGLGQPGDERSDLYSLAVLFYQLVTGQLPYDADTPLAVVLKHVNDPLPDPQAINATLPSEISEIILKAMAKKPQHRYQSVHDFSRALRQAVRRSSVDLGTVLPASLLQDKPTPLPSQTASSWGASADSTMVAPTADATQIAPMGSATVVAPAASPAAATAAPAAAPRRFPVWAIVGLVVLFLVAVGAAVTLGGGGDTDPTTAELTQLAALVEDPTNTPVADSTVPPTPDQEATTEAQVAEQVAAINGTLTAQAPTPSHTPTASPTAVTPTPSATPSPTVNGTQAFLDSCTTAYELSDFYIGRTQSTNTTAPVGLNSTANFVLKNTGTCPLAADLLFKYIEGTDFPLPDDPDGLALDEVLAAGDELLLTTRITAPNSAGTYAATWQLFTAADEPIGDPVEFSIRAYVPSTPTPTPAPATPTSAAATPTTGAVNVDFNVFFSNCEYPGGGSEWRCQLVITPFGGAGNTYTVFVFDTEPPARYFGTNNPVHFITARRCAAWIHEIKVQDEASGATKTKNIFFDPTTQPLFPNGTTCTES